MHTQVNSGSPAIHPNAVKRPPYKINNNTLSLRPSSIMAVDLHYEERKTLINAFEKFRPAFLADDDNQIEVYSKLGAEMISSSFNSETVNKLQQFFEQSYQYPALMFRGLPMPLSLPPTPTKTGFIETKEFGFSAALLLGIYSFFGCKPTAYAGENNDEIFRHVVPVENATGEVSSQGSKFTFGMHVDNPHLPLENEPVRELSACPQYLALKCMRTDISVPTNVILLDDVLSGLSEFIVKGLQKPIYNMVRPDSFGPEKSMIKNLPVVSRTKCGYYLTRFDKKFAEPSNDEAAFYFNAFISALENHHDENRLVLTPGDVLLFHNQRVLHSREEFTPKFNGLDRWLIRLYGISDITRHKKVSDQNNWLGKA